MGIVAAVIKTLSHKHCKIAKNGKKQHGSLSVKYVKICQLPT